jgi:hypothetical protein
MKHMEKERIDEALNCSAWNEKVIRPELFPVAGRR